jgi:hypothetical protein
VYQADAGMKVRVRLGLGNMRYSAPQLCMAITGPVKVGQPDCRGCVTLTIKGADLALQILMEDATEPLGCHLATSIDLPIANWLDGSCTDKTFRAPP